MITSSLQAREIDQARTGVRRLEIQSNERASMPTALPSPSNDKASAFSDVLMEAVAGVRAAFAEANEAGTEALLGRGTPHHAMVAMTKADLSFRFMTQTRNKLVDAYREIMSLQV